MKAHLQRARDLPAQPPAGLIWLWTEADPGRPAPDGWYLVLENSALAIRVLIAPPAAPASPEPLCPLSLN